MGERDLMILFTVSYQLSQAVSYLAEMLDNDCKQTIEYVKEEPSILRFKVQSWHVSRALRRCFIRYKLNNFGVSGVTHCEMLSSFSTMFLTNKKVQ